MFLFFVALLVFALREKIYGVPHPWNPDQKGFSFAKNATVEEMKTRTEAWALLIFGIYNLLLSFLALYVSLGCNKTPKRVKIAPVAFIFPLNYLVQHVRRRYVKMEPFYCSHPNELFIENSKSRSKSTSIISPVPHE
jgi:tellurite resistance protein TehA-like permease